MLQLEAAVLVVALVGTLAVAVDPSPPAWTQVAKAAAAPAVAQLRVCLAAIADLVVFICLIYCCIAWLWEMGGGGGAPWLGGILHKTNN